MKKIAPYIIVFLAALLVMNVFNYSHDFNVDFDGDRIDGPLGTLIGLRAGGLGIVLAIVLGLLAMSPLLLPLAVPVLIIWYLASRNRKNRERAEALKAEPV